MGLWRFNPPEPCCNPPAGFCQCTPCAWKITDWQWVSTPLTITLVKPDLELETVDYFGLVDQQVGIDSLRFWGHAARRLDGEQPPWRRLWRAEFELDLGFESEIHRWYFGYWRWVISGATALDSARFDRVGWGFGVDIAGDGDFGVLGNTMFPAQIPGNANFANWHFYRGHHDYAFRCRGANRVMFDGNFLIGGDPFNPNDYVTFEPHT